MTPSAKKRPISIHDVVMYVAVLRKHMRLMALLFAFTMLAGLVYYVYARPVYYSRALVKVEDVALPVDTEKLYRDGRIALVMRELQAYYVQERAAASLGVKMSARGLKLRHLIKQRIQLSGEGNLEIESWTGSREWAEKWPKALVDAYVAARLEKRLRDRDEAINRYLREIEEVTGKLDSNLVERFKSRDEQAMTEHLIKMYSMKSVPAEVVNLTRQIDEMGRIRVKLQDVSLDVVSKLSLISSFEKDSSLAVGQQVPMGGSAPLEKLESNVGDENRPAGGQPANPGLVVVPSMLNAMEPWQELEKEQQMLKVQIADAARTFLPGHQKMIALNKQLEEVNRKLEGEYATAEKRFSMEFQNLLNKREDLRAKLPEWEELNRKNEKMRQERQLWESAQLPWQKIYSEIKKQMEALDYAGEKERVDLSFIGVAENSGQPMSPNRGKLMLTSLMIGLVVAIAVPFLVEYLDHTLTNLENAENQFRLRGLGIVPRLEFDAKASEDVLISAGEDRENNLIENFRAIRTNLLSIAASGPAPQVIMVTSAVPREGKTVVASNLALSFAHTGSRTLLIDADLRRGRLHRLFGYRKSPGLSDVLLGTATLEEALRPSNTEGLTVITVGKHLDASTEVLCSKLTSDIFTELRGRFDRIVVDITPVLGLSDTSVLQRLVDGVLFVIWSGNTPVRTVNSALEQLRANGANMYGFVLNRLDLNSTTNYYQYYYYHHDYYYRTIHALEDA